MSFRIMNAILCTLVFAALGQHTSPGDRLDNAKWQSLGYASIIYVSQDSKSEIKDLDLIRYLSRHAVPAAKVGNFHRAAPIVNAKGAASNSKIVILTASQKTSAISLSVFVSDPDKKVDLKGKPDWSFETTLQKGDTSSSALNRGLDKLIEDWRRSRGHRGSRR